MAALRGALRVTVNGLKQHYGQVDLVAINDWHQHDGVVLPGRATIWRELEDALESDTALFEARDDDDYVYRAFYPRNGEFLLRFDVFDWDESLYSTKHPALHRKGIWGMFDLAAPTLVLEAIFAELGDDHREEISMGNAKQFFDGTYAG